MAFPPAGISLHVRWVCIAPFVAFGAAVVLHQWGGPAALSILGTGWIIAARNELLDWGVLSPFGSTYLVQSLLALPQWVVLAGITFCLGLTHSRPAHQFAWLFSVSVPFSRLLLFATYPTAYEIPLGVTLRFMLLVPAFGTLIGITSWWVGYLLRGRHDHFKSGTCHACGYDLRGGGSKECPECGQTSDN